MMLVPALAGSGVAPSAVVVESSLSAGWAYLAVAIAVSGAAVARAVSVVGVCGVV